MVCGVVMLGTGSSLTDAGVENRGRCLYDGARQADVANDNCKQRDGDGSERATLFHADATLVSNVLTFTRGQRKRVTWATKAPAGVETIHCSTVVGLRHRRRDSLRKALYSEGII